MERRFLSPLGEREDVEILTEKKVKKFVCWESSFDPETPGIKRKI